MYKLVIKRNQKLSITVNLENNTSQLQFPICTMLYEFDENGKSVVNFNTKDHRVLRRINRLLNKLKKEILCELDNK